MCMLDPEAPESELSCCYRVTCRYHLLWDIQDGRVAAVHPVAAKLAQSRPIATWSDERIMEMVEALPESCAIDAACGGEMTFDAIGEAIGMSGEAVRQAVSRTPRRLKSAMRAAHYHHQVVRRLEVIRDDLEELATRIDRDDYSPGEQLEIIL